MWGPATSALSSGLSSEHPLSCGREPYYTALAEWVASRQKLSLKNAEIIRTHAGLALGAVLSTCLGLTG